jgi:predicted outer membrane repeat protein
MPTFILRSITVWNDYFTGSPTLIQTKEYKTTQTLSGTSVYVSNCLFSSITSTSYGGALYCTSVTYLLIESSTFFSCNTSSSKGGAIYFSNSAGQCVLYSVCGYDCCTTYNGYSEGQFSRIYVNDGASSKNCVNYSSITRCVNDNSNSWYILYPTYGKIYFPSVNISMNKCGYRSAIYCIPTTDSNSIACSLSYSSFVDNNATGYTCIRFDRENTKFEIKSCNILRNTQISLNTEGTIYTRGNLVINDSCILENKANSVFSVQSTHTITISNCTVDSTSNNGYLTIQNTVTKSFIHALNHMSTQNCHSGYDSVGTLFPIIQHTSRKQMDCYTRGNFFNHSPIRDFVLLTCASLLLKLLPQ